MTTNARGRAVALALVLAPLAGCGGGGPVRVPVSGLVTYQGTPVPKGLISFEPEDPAAGQSATAGIAAGRYAIPTHEGLMAGQYRVRIMGDDPDYAASIKIGPDGTPSAERPPREMIPAAYNVKSALTCEVRPDTGPAKFDFELK